jgi:predicted membrane channel-forming protein YqfA (hemolysin III family)
MLPAHMLPLLLMLMVGVTLGVTLMVIALLVAVFGVAQVLLLVNTTVTTSPLFNVVDTKLALLLPALLPFTFHW